MQKYGVDESKTPETQKQASEGCPICGSKVEHHGQILMCPVHGSEPFEKVKKEKEKE